MASFLYFRYSFFFETPLSYQDLAEWETELRSGDLRFHEIMSLRSKGKKRNCVGKTENQLLFTLLKGIIM